MCRVALLFRRLALAQDEYHRDDERYEANDAGDGQDHCDNILAWAFSPAHGFTPFSAGGVAGSARRRSAHPAAIYHVSGMFSIIERRRTV
jgi:hypothetical protein